MAAASGEPDDSAATFFLPDDNKELIDKFLRPNRPYDDKQLIDKFLRPKMAGKPLPPAARFIHNADVFSITPGVLAATHAPAPGARPVWYFFSPVHYYCGMRQVRCARRIIGKGYWQSEHMAPKIGGAADGWYRKLFRFVDIQKILESPEDSWLPPEWWMAEYGLTEEEDDQQQLVLCAVFGSLY